jgi:predicted Ser/Thr protein kinase/tetratricopeptide (TPR) repeat protein
MNSTEIRLSERLIQTGRLSPENLKRVLHLMKGGTGLIDTLLGQEMIGAPELETVLSGMPAPEPAPSEPDPLLKSVRRLERYTVLTTLGRGGIGRVYLAYDTKLKRSVALKAMRVEASEDLPRYRREVEIASSLHHSNIAAVYDTESVDDVFVISMQYIDGKSLHQLRLSTREALELVAQAARTVQAAHDRGIIHRDLKPANLMRTEEGGLFVLDFGTARPVGTKANLTQSGTVVGTPAYMSPEQAQGGELDARTDVYSLGATLYALVTFHPPFEGATLLELIRRVMFERPARPRQINPRLHRDIELIVLKAMSPELPHRYATASELARDIERFLAGEPIQARPPSLPERSWRYLRRRPWAMATVAAVLLGLVATAGVSLAQLGRQSRLSEAHARIEQAGHRVDRWDQLLYLPPQDLTPYRSLLDEAEALLGKAAELAGPDLAREHYLRARIEIRKGRQDAAERSIDRAIALDSDETFLVERIRIRLLGLERNLVDVADLIGQGWMEPGTIARPRLPSGFDPGFRKSLEGDFARLRGGGAEARKERAYLEAVRLALEGRLAEAEETAQAALRALPPGERDELSKVLALVDYLEFARQFERGAAPELDFSLASRLDQAIGHFSDAIAIRESDADLYVLRALLWIARGAFPVSLLQSAHPRVPAGDAPAQQERWRAISRAVGGRLPELEAWTLESAERARRDVERSLLIRPDDARTHLVLPYVHLLSFPLSDMTRLADEWASLEEPLTNLPFLLKAAALFKRYEERHLLPGLEACRRAASLDPALGLAWAGAAWLQGIRLQNLLSLGGARRTELEEETLQACARALELRVGGRIEAGVRAVKARIHLSRAAGGRGAVEEERRKAEAEIRRIEELDPELAGGIERPRPFR